MNDKLSETPASSAGGTKTCMICAQEIPGRALKCTRCGTYQNWRRHLTSLTVLISLFLGGASVFSTMYPVAKDLAAVDFDVEIMRVGVNARHYTAWVRNSGRRPVAIKYINVFYGENLESLEIEGGDSVIPPGATRILRLVLPEDFERPARPVDFSRREFDAVRQRCEVSFSIIGSYTEEWFNLEEKWCSELEDFLTGIQSVG